MDKDYRKAEFFTNKEIWVDGAPNFVLFGLNMAATEYGYNVLKHAFENEKRLTNLSAIKYVRKNGLSGLKGLLDMGFETFFKTAFDNGTIGCLEPEHDYASFVILSDMGLLTEYGNVFAAEIRLVMMMGVWCEMIDIYESLRDK